MKTSINSVLTVSKVNKTFRLPNEKHNSLKHTILNIHKRGYSDLDILKNITFEVKKGEFFGIVGRNGSGKSTLLKLIAGIYQPSSGDIKVNGHLTPFIELGVGFNMELSGRDNVYLNGAILGLSKKQVSDKYEDIVSFAELADFMDQKLKNYSSGMLVRLAFAVAIQAHNDVLLIDEVLAVGDAAFQQKCFDVFKEIKRSGTTVIFVTHDMSAVEQFCDRAMLIEKGRVKAVGNSRDVANVYRDMMNETLDLGEASNAVQQEEAKPKKRWGDGQAKITKVVLKSDGKVIKKVEAQNKFSICVNAIVNKPIVKPIFGIILRDTEGNILLFSNTQIQNVKTGSYKAGDSLDIEWELPNVFNNDRYSAAIAIADESGKRFYDWWEDALVFRCSKRQKIPGVIQASHTIKVKRQST